MKKETTYISHTAYNYMIKLLEDPRIALAFTFAANKKEIDECLKTKNVKSKEKN